MIDLLLSRLFAASLELAVLAGLAGLGIRLLRVRSPRVVALLWVVVMVKPLVSLAAGPLVPPLALHLPPMGPSLPQIEREVDLAYYLLPAPLVSEEPRLLTALALLWMLGVVGAVAYAFWDRLRLARLLAASRPAEPALRERMEAVAFRLGLRKAPRLRVTEALESPALAGTVRPVVLLPAWLVEQGSPEQLDWALGHELMHRELRDPWCGAVRHLLQVLFFFHPAAWWVGRKWEEAAELACDRALVASREEAVSYAERLYEMLAKAGAQRRVAVAGGLFATRTQIGRRIAALLQAQVAGRPRLTLGSALVLGLLTLGSLGVSASCGFYSLLGDVETELVAPGWKGLLQAKGAVDFDWLGRGVASLEPGGFLNLEETDNGTVRRLEVRPGPDGPQHAYWVNGKPLPFEGEGRAWMERALPRLLRR